jgi:hypothetical protein
MLFEEFNEISRFVASQPVSDLLDIQVGKNQLPFGFQYNSIDDDIFWRFAYDFGCRLIESLNGYSYFSGVKTDCPLRMKMFFKQITEQMHIFHLFAFVLFNVLSGMHFTFHDQQNAMQIMPEDFGMEKAVFLFRFIYHEVYDIGKRALLAAQANV